jgi:hypothetical protein
MEEKALSEPSSEGPPLLVIKRSRFEVRQHGTKASEREGNNELIVRRTTRSQFTHGDPDALREAVQPEGSCRGPAAERNKGPILEVLHIFSRSLAS